MKHEFIPMTKNQYKDEDYLHNTTRIENIRNDLQIRVDPYTLTKLNIRHMKFTGWYHKHGVTGQFKEPVKILSKLIGFPPTTYHNFTHRCAVWAFFWGSQPVLLFNSVRGVTLQVSASFPASLLRPFYTDLLQKLDCQGTLYWRKRK